MEDQKISTSSANVEASSPDANSKQESKKEDFVKYESFEKLLGQHKNSKAEAERLQSELASLKAQEQERKERELAEKGEWKKLVELRDNEVKTLQQRIAEVENEKNHAHGTLIDAHKLQAVCDKLPGRVKNPKYLQWINLDEVAFNPDTREIDEASVQLAVNAFMEEHKDLVDTSHVGRLPADYARTATPLHKRFSDLPLNEMRKNIKLAVTSAKNEKGI